MNGITQARTDLVVSLQEAGIKAYSTLPERMTAPCAAISTGDPYLEEGDTFSRSDAMLVRFELFLVSGTGTNEKAVSDLEQMITDAILYLGDYTVVVGPPTMREANGAYYLSSVLTITKMINLLGGN